MVQFEFPKARNPCLSSFLCVIRFLIFCLPLPGGNENWPPQYKDEKVGKFEEQNWLNRLQMVQFECPRNSKPCVSLWLGEFHFLHFCLLLSGALRIGLPSIEV